MPVAINYSSKRITESRETEEEEEKPITSRGIDSVVAPFARLSTTTEAPTRSVEARASSIIAFLESADHIERDNGKNG